MDFLCCSSDMEWNDSNLDDDESIEDDILEPESFEAGGLNTTESDMENPLTEKFNLVRKWSLNKWKYTRQLMSEMLGYGSRTIDLELGQQIDILKDNKKRYENILNLAHMYSTHLFHMVCIQKQLGSAFRDFSVRSPDLKEEFGKNVDAQLTMAKNGEILSVAINAFIENLDTFVNKTMEDTLLTVKQYEVARVEYDAYRTDLEELEDEIKEPYSLLQIRESKLLFQTHKEKYEQIRNDVTIKLRFLEENKLRVLRQQLALFHDATSAYSTGNQSKLEETLAQFHLK